MEDFQLTHFALLDLTYEYLDTGYKLIATTDVPCHLYCRMTTTEPRKHSLPSGRRGLRLTGDIRFCFVVYEDNEQTEAGDTLTHTFIKDGWPVCTDRWFYFIGEILNVSVVSETAIFKFHFPGPPPDQPPPITKVFLAEANNRTIEASDLTWPPAHDAGSGTILGNYVAPNYALFAGSYMRGGWHYIYRSFLTFDTIHMALGAKILSATLSPWVFYAGGVTLKRIYVTQGAQHDPVIASDYGAQLPYTTIGGEKLGIVTGNYQDIPLNPAGLSWIKPGAKSLFCLRGQTDLLDEHPVATYTQMIYYYSSQKGEGYQPKLTVTYYPAVKIC